MSARRLALALAFLIPATPAHAQDRSLHWRALEVEAQLDADGRLHVGERHAMVFTGDWNGGERRFRLALGQRLELESVSRLDPATGREIPLARGNLDAVDHYDWADSQTLRWRSRLPSDPSFDSTEIVTVLRYTLSDILLPRDGGDFLLDHDFAFPDRDGPIERFALALELDPAWQPRAPFAGRWERGRLEPGESVVVDLPLRHIGAGRPAGVHFGAPAGVRLALAAVLIAFLALRLAAFYRRERALGRFEPLVPVGAIDGAWLGAHVFSLLPEVVGAAWDDRTGAPEVAAVLARMVGEGKLRSEVQPGRSSFSRRPVLHLELCVSPDELPGYEAMLVRKLFVGGGTTTDTERIRRHYRSRGFDPAALLRAPLARQVKAIFRRPSGAPRVSWKPAVLLFAGGIGSMVAAGLRRHEEFLLLPAWIAPAAFLVTLAATQAVAWQRRSAALGLHALRFLVPVLALAGALLALLARASFRTSALALLGLCLVAAALFEGVLNAARSRHAREQIGLRRQLAAAHRYFQAELRRRDPKLDDAWFPYLLALGLGPHADRWFRAFGGSSTGAGPFPGGASSSGSGGWTGGGGAFGGGGASASWAAAAGSLAAGVSAPSSSSGGGGGGGGGGSSGGGGGGGW